MANIVVVGSQWGDEGKGKIVDFLTSKADVVARYQGGSNAGHEVVVGDEHYVLHLIPSGILHKGKVCLIGNGVVIDPKALLEEMLDLQKKGFRIQGNLFISEAAHVTFPYHRVLDEAKEMKRGGTRIGTTHRGIGPTYSDKMGRVGIRVIDLMEPRTLKAKLYKNVEEKNALFAHFYGIKPLSAKKIYREYLGYAKKLRPLVADTSVLLDQAFKKGKSVLLEGAQGTFLDVDFGTYPFVTASNPIAGGACIGLGFGPSKVDKVIGVMKAYTTRVGFGPFPTEFPAKLGEQVREKGNEYGRTTGRARRCGWLDLVLLKRAVRVNGLTGIAVTKLDILDDMAKIKICVAYRCGGKVFREFPNSYSMVEKAKPLYIEMPGWQRSTENVTSYRELPVQARRYLEKVASFVGTKISLISVGAKRDQIIVLDPGLKKH